MSERGRFLVGIASIEGGVERAEQSCVAMAPRGPFRRSDSYCEPGGHLAWQLTNGSFAAAGAAATAVAMIGNLYEPLTIQGLDSSSQSLTVGSDAAAIAHAYEQWGLDAFDKINGSFFIAVWDQNRRRLVLARDRFGAVPAYYRHDAKRILFSNSIHSLLAVSTTPRELDLTAVHQYFVMRSVYGSEKLLRGIHELLPGELLIYEAGTIKTHLAMSVPQPAADPAINEKQAIDTIEHCVEDSVAVRRSRTGRLGVLISGGLDSSYLAIVAGKQSPTALDSFFSGVADYDFDYSQHAAFVAKQSGARHHESRLDRYQFADLMPEANSINEEPIGHPGSVLRLAVYRRAAELVDDVFCGEGVDSALCSFPVVYLLRLERLMRVFPSPLRRLLGKLPDQLLGSGQASRFARVKLALSRSAAEVSILDAAVAMPEEAALLIDPPAERNPIQFLIDQFNACAGGDSFRGMSHLLRGPLLAEVMPHSFKLACATGLIVHYPYLDLRFFAESARIPMRLLNQRFIRKFIFKRLLERHLPKEFIYKRKEGFGAPLEKWWSDPKSLGRYLEMLEEPRTQQRGLFRRQELSRLVAQHRGGRGTVASSEGMIWTAVNLELWCRQTLDRESLGAWR